jgi:predicted metalloprotease
MKWEDGDASGNVEDRRGMGGAVAAGGGIIGLIVMAVAFYMTGDLRQAKFIADRVGPVVNKAVPQRNPGQGKAGVNDRMLDFSKKIMGYTDRAWADVFAVHGKRYEKPTLVLFTDRVDSEGCGVAPSSVGPFYCPASRKVFVDPSFFEELESRLRGSKADFSKAYVIAHEVGHHVQNLLGYNSLVEQFRRREGENAGIRLELQADYLAGVCWNRVERERSIIEPGDVESAIVTAKAIGDDRLQKNARGWVNPESFNHGTSAQRLKWFTEGLRTGDAEKKALDRFFNPNIPPLKL